MEQIPLFPLNSVLFPGWPLPLHIFEPRYLQMTQHCVSEDIPFGVVLLQEGKPEGDRKVKPYRVGCTARIRQIQNLEDGRLLIMTIGEKRFRIHRLHREQPYLEASVEYIQFKQEAADATQAAADDLYPIFADFLDILSEMDDTVQINSSNIPVDPETLSFTAAALLQTSMRTKQSMLEARKLTSLLNYLQRIYRHEIGLLQQFPTQEMGNFSVN